MRLVMIVACGALLFPAMAVAAEPPQATASQLAATPKAATPKKDKKICKKTGDTGSRLGGRTECRTRAEWDDASHRQRMEIERKLNTAPAGQ